MIRIQPTQGWGKIDLKELWYYRDLLRFHILRDIKGKYRQMALGPLWIILQPIINMVIFSLIFGKIANLPSEDIPYPLFTYTAIIPWTYFSNASQQSVDSLVREMGVISKVYFPRLIIPFSAIFAGLVDFIMSFFILLIMMFAYGFVPNIISLVMIPFCLFIAVSTALTLSLWTAILTVRFRDVSLIVKHGLSVAMYLTPVAYSATVIPNKWLWIYKLNPMYWVADGFRWSLLGKGNGPEVYMLISLGFVMVLLVLGANIFRKRERTIVDLL